MDLEIPHSVTYDFDGRATVEEVSKSLLAQEKLVREAFAVLDELFPNLTFGATRIEFREASQNSPFKTALYAIVAASYAPALGEDVPDLLNTLFGVDVHNSYDSVVSVLVLVIAIWGIDEVRKKLFVGKKQPELEAEKQRLLAAAANKTYVTQDQLEEVLDKTLKKHKRSVMKAAATFLEPAKRHKARSITVTGGEVIKQKAIEAMPSDIDLAQYEPPTEFSEHENVIIKFRAHDLDKNKAWAATIEDISSSRRPLHLAPDVRPEQLFDKVSIRGDVLVTSTLDADGEYVPNLYYLQKVHEDQS